MPPVPLAKHSLLQALPPEGTADLLPAIQKMVKASGRKVVVLDDDPTGTQTVHDIPVLTEWSSEALCAELQNDLPAVYLLTNSRSFSLAEAQSINAEIGQNLTQAARRTGRDFVVVSRSDSTLRGHFPGEMSALAEALDGVDRIWLVIPCFFEGGRYTVGDIHYVEEDSQLVPVGETAFAQDAVFGYRSSNLRDWIEEKTNGHIRSSEVVSISIDLIRSGGYQQVAQRLCELTPGQVCVVNAASYRDLQIFVLGLLKAEAQGHVFLYRTAASFVSVRAGITQKPLLTRQDLDMSGAGGGLIVVGSYVNRTSSQLDVLLADSSILPYMVSVESLLDEKSRQVETERVSALVNAGIKSGQDAVIYTSRELVTADSVQNNIHIGQVVSAGLVSIIQNLETRPRYLLAKGGITASDIATKALGIRRAMVLGQILPGVPVWQPGVESRYPGMPFIVFPGNVGDAQALIQIVKNCSRQSL
jgi:uncharacterized protein YgbK (DUF1537 family)